MRNIKRLFAVSAGLFFIGCASTHYYLNGQSQEQYNFRSAQCNNIAASNINANQAGSYMGRSLAGGGAALGFVGAAMVFLDSYLYDIRFEECMRLYGFTKAHPSMSLAQEAYKSGNYSQAFLLFKEAADANDHMAQLMVGVMCEEGKGVPKDDAEALRWYRKAADHGNVPANDILKKKGL